MSTADNKWGVPSTCTATILDKAVPPTPLRGDHDGTRECPVAPPTEFSLGEHYAVLLDKLSYHCGWEEGDYIYSDVGT